MNHYPTKGESLWNATVRRTEFSSHRGDLDVDVAVIGAGIAGLTTAYMLKQKGKKVAVFEKYQIGDSVTGYTTAKVSSQHGLIYHELIEKHGKGHAQVYADANQGAIDMIEAIIATENISCEWRRADSYVYTDKSSELRAIKDEVLAAQSLGLPASYTESLPLNIAAKAAVRFTHQASFNVLDYLYGLANAIEGQGSRVYEHTKVSNVHDGERVTFKVPGGTVTANEVVLATNIPSPILDHIAYGLYEYPVRSYLIAGPVESRIDDMYINTGNPTRSIHSLNINGKPWMMMGGEAHMVGVSGPAEGHYRQLETAARKYGMKKAVYKWSTWDYVPYDGLPMVGKLFPHSKHIYTLTGFRKWGMTNATMAASIITDLLTGKDNPWAETFKTNRLSAVKAMPSALMKGFIRK